MPHQELYNKIFTEQQENHSPKEQLQAVINENPYFSIAHFFLLKETETTDHNYRKIAARTALHFNNPFLLRYQLNRKLVEKVDEVEKVEKAEKVDMIHFVENVEEVQKIKKVEEHNVVEEIKDTQKIEMVNFVEYKEEPQKADLTINPGKKEELLFEPLHTTDYFASQGIKLGEEVQSNDKLGKQLKSFTDWLKTMKRVHHGKLPEGSNIDPVVQNMAEKSNKEPEVLTEAMAEVHVQQGKAEKAVEIYRKLSLLNPAKSAYFAAKIELLKDN